MPQKSSGSRDARITRWATALGQVASKTGFAARLDGSQVDAELLHIFRETPSFGRDLAERLSPFIDEGYEGNMRLFSGGGEAAVFIDPDSQQAIKLFAPNSGAGFGWVIERNAKDRLAIRGGSLTESLVRFARCEELFPTGLELDQIGSEGDFLVLRQPFIVGGHPDEQTLHDWMFDQGWEPFSPATDQHVLLRQSWLRDGFIATDVRPANAMIAECDDELRGIDFIVARLDELN